MTPKSVTDGAEIAAEAVVEPAEPAPVQETATAEAADKEAVTLVYMGAADLFQIGSLKIRPGQPVTVPSELAEELLTYPNEPFEVYQGDQDADA